MRILRIILAGYFAFFAAWCILATYWAITDLNRIHDRSWILLSISIAVLFAGMGTVFGLAWWSNWKRWASSRSWAVVASILSLAIPVGVPVFQYFVNGWKACLQSARIMWLPMVIGVAVLVVFAVFPQKPDPFPSHRANAEVR